VKVGHGGTVVEFSIVGSNIADRHNSGLATTRAEHADRRNGNAAQLPAAIELKESRRESIIARNVTAISFREI
jgi:hypothetical protein